VLEENILVTLVKKNDTEILGKGHKEFEEFRNTLITCEGKEIKGIGY
jgi:hypothetical protein